MLLSPRLDQILSAKDLTILKLYFALMGKEVKSATKKAGFIQMCKQFFATHKAELRII